MGPEQNPRVSLTPKLFTRDGKLDKDPLLKNCYKDGFPENWVAARRPALVMTREFAGIGVNLKAVTSLLGYSVVIYDLVLSFISGLAVTSHTLTTPGLPQFFFAASAQLKKVLTKSGVDAYVTELPPGLPVVTTKITDPDYPAITVGGAVYLDGTFYVMDNQGNIYGSAIGDPMTWTALNFIQMDMGKSPAVGIARHLNYLVAFSQSRTQFFYDAANPAPGSPLSVMQNAQFSVGCAAIKTVQNLNDNLIFVACGPQPGNKVAMFIGLQLKVVSTPSVDRILQGTLIVEDTVTSTTVSYDGHDLYILNVDSPNAGKISLIYDLTADEWYVWTSYLDQFPEERSFNLLFPDSGTTTGWAFGGRSYQLTNAAGYDTYAGGIKNYETVIRTEPVDGRIINYKFLNVLYVLSDTVQFSTCTIRYSDDDGLTWSSYGTVSLSSLRKQLRRLGKFRKRIFELTCSDSFRQRFEALELDSMIGNS